MTYEVTTKRNKLELLFAGIVYVMNSATDSAQFFDDAGFFQVASLK